MDSIQVRVARRLLEIKAVFLRPQEPFTWASGIKSPIYCDNRLILTAPEARNEVEQADMRRKFCSSRSQRRSSKHSALLHTDILIPTLQNTGGEGACPLRRFVFSSGYSSI